MNGTIFGQEPQGSTRPWLSALQPNQTRQTELSGATSSDYAVAIENHDGADEHVMVSLVSRAMVCQRRSPDSENNRPPFPLSRQPIFEHCRFGTDTPEDADVSRASMIVCASMKVMDTSEKEGLHGLLARLFFRIP